MSDIAIRVENLSKRYRIGALKPGDLTLRETLMDVVGAPSRWLANMSNNQIPKDNPQRKNGDQIWALKNISFEVKHGEVIGIIGRNGAGKSTLLKILSRITKPTLGHAEIHGRVGSLLEVGTGFHPELTGRENIYLSGAILGMKKSELDKKFDEIVDFSGVEKFIDTPVKRYSSGMQVRLGFAVAAHLEPEILLVDEVLAVGDAAFQKKCLGKMDHVAQEGRTVLFVSHNMVAVQSLCERAFWLHDGEIKDRGSAGEVVSNYLQSSFSSLTEQVWNDIVSAPGNEQVRIHRVCVRPIDGSSSDPIQMDKPFVIEVEFWNLISDAHLHITLHIQTEHGIVAFTTGSLHDPEWHDRPFPVGLFRSVCHVPGDLLNSGVHRVLLLIIRDQASVLYRHDDALSFEVLDSGKGRGAWYGKEPGVVQPLLEWKTECLHESEATIP